LYLARVMELNEALQAPQNTEEHWIVGFEVCIVCVPSCLCVMCVRWGGAGRRNDLKWVWT
jgi:hypothetical protein